MWKCSLEWKGITRRGGMIRLFQCRLIGMNAKRML